MRPTLFRLGVGFPFRRIAVFVIAALLILSVLRISNDVLTQHARTRNSEHEQFAETQSPEVAPPCRRANPVELFTSRLVRLVKIDNFNSTYRSEARRCMPMRFAVYEPEVRNFLMPNAKSNMTLASLLPEATLIEIRENDPRLRSRNERKSINRPITTHLFVCTGALIYHFAILIDRGTYYWMGKVESTDLKAIADHCCDSAEWIERPAMAIDKHIFEPIRATLADGIFEPANISLFSWHLPFSRFLECDLENIVWPFMRIYPSFVEHDGRESITASLLELRHFALVKQLPIVLYAGTLLGWYRNCDYISYSNDIDTGLEREYMSEALFRLMYTTFRISERYGKFGADRVLCPGTKACALELVLYSKTNVKMDLFTIQQDDNGVTYNDYYSFAGGHNLHRNLFPNFTLAEKCTVELLGALAYAPCDPMVPIRAEFDAVEWFQPVKGKLAKNFNYVKKFNVSEYRQLHYVYSHDRCEQPSLMWGCDEPPSVPPVTGRPERTPTPSALRRATTSVIKSQMVRTRSSLTTSSITANEDEGDEEEEEATKTVALRAKISPS